MVNNLVIDLSLLRAPVTILAQDTVDISLNEPASDTRARGHASLPVPCCAIWRSNSLSIRQAFNFARVGTLYPHLLSQSLFIQDILTAWTSGLICGSSSS